MKLTARATLVPRAYSISKIAPEHAERHGDHGADQADLDGADDGVVGAAALAPRGDAALALQPPGGGEDQPGALADHGVEHPDQRDDREHRGQGDVDVGQGVLDRPRAAGPAERERLGGVGAVT